MTQINEYYVRLTTVHFKALFLLSKEENVVSLSQKEK